MKRRELIMSKAALVFLTVMLISGFVSQVKGADPTEQQGLVDKARITFQSMIKDDNMGWLRDNLHKAKGLLIIPNMLKGGFIFGGSGGSGVLIVKDEKSGDWSQPGFYTIGSVTFGLQIGGEAAEVIMYLRTQRAMEKLLASSFKLGGDTSVAVGPVGGGGKASALADILSFARSKGLYGGVNLEGAVVKTRDKWNKAYYGQEVRPIDIFVKRSVSSPGSAELRKAVASAAKAK